jgi:hypothetical protein
VDGEQLHRPRLSGAPVVAHGRASNGQFLFVLQSDGALDILSLMNASSVGAPFSMLLEAPVDASAHLIASDRCLIVHTNAENALDKIAKFLSGAPAQSRLASSLHFAGHSFAGDGMTALHIAADGAVAVFSQRHS